MKLSRSYHSQYKFKENKADFLNRIEVLEAGGMRVRRTKLLHYENVTQLVQEKPFKVL
jgi:hypothetical protein